MVTLLMSSNKYGIKASSLSRSGSIFIILGYGSSISLSMGDYILMTKMDSGTMTGRCGSSLMVVISHSGRKVQRTYMAQIKGAMKALNAMEEHD